MSWRTKGCPLVWLKPSFVTWSSFQAFTEPCVLSEQGCAEMPVHLKKPETNLHAVVNTWGTVCGHQGRVDKWAIFFRICWSMYTFTFFPLFSSSQESSKCLHELRLKQSVDLWTYGLYLDLDWSTLVHTANIDNVSSAYETLPSRDWIHMYGILEGTVMSQRIDLPMTSARFWHHSTLQSKKIQAR